jgi:nitrate/TMAO reductase-like tetraheme cytochrome c subunit
MLIGAIALGMALSNGCSMAPLTRVTSQDFPKPQACSECHVDIYNEWKASPHAQAFINPRYLAATDDHTFEQCLPCHAPQPAITRSEPKVRTVSQDLGVTCVSCHLDQGAMVGPLPPTGMVKPHPIRVDPSPFEAGRLCGNCHQGTLAQWQAAKTDSKVDCRECHMPAVERKTTQATSEISKVFVRAEKVVREHQHSFTMIPADLPSPAVSLQINVENGDAKIHLTNLLPHNLPTGDFGFRVIEVVAEGIDAAQKSTPLGRWELTNAAGGYLSAGQERTWSCRIPPDLRAVRVSISRFGRDDSGRFMLLRREVAIP